MTADVLRRAAMVIQKMYDRSDAGRGHQCRLFRTIGICTSATAQRVVLNSACGALNDMH